MKDKFIVLFLLVFGISYSISPAISSINTIANPWVKVESPVYPVLHNLFFLSTLEGWVVGDSGTVLYTTDGGENWVKLNGGTETTLRVVFFSDSNNGYIGGDGIILRTTDGGNNWSHTTGDFSIQGIYFKQMNKIFGYAVSSDGQVL